MKLEKLDKFYYWQAPIYNFSRKFFLFDRRKALNFLNIKSSDKVLDFACGTGLNINYFIKKVPAGNITGIDYSNSMLKIAKNKFPDVEFVQADVSKHKFGKKFDKIVSTYSISMINNWEKSIINAKNSLKKNGTLLILDFYRWHGFIKIFYPFFKWWLSRHGVDSEKKIISFLKKHFKKVEINVLKSGYDFMATARGPKS